MVSLRFFCRSLPRARVTEVRERLRTGPAHFTALPAICWSRGHRCGGGTARAVVSSQCPIPTSPEPPRQAALDTARPEFSHRGTCHLQPRPACCGNCRPLSTALVPSEQPMWVSCLYSWEFWNMQPQGSDVLSLSWPAPSHVSEVQESKQLLTILFQGTSSTCFLFFFFCCQMVRMSLTH